MKDLLCKGGEIVIVVVVLLVRSECQCSALNRNLFCKSITLNSGSESLFTILSPSKEPWRRRIVTTARGFV